MKAIVLYKNGGPEIFEYTDVEVPEVGSHEVLILEVLSRSHHPLDRPR
jgi:NADPH:quinone reductase-like Zn-dependent oxidoreductase